MSHRPTAGQRRHFFHTPSIPRSVTTRRPYDQARFDGLSQHVVDLLRPVSTANRVLQFPTGDLPPALDDPDEPIGEFAPWRLREAIRRPLHHGHRHRVREADAPLDIRQLDPGPGSQPSRMVASRTAVSAIRPR
jgi:hypothetical protein